MTLTLTQPDPITEATHPFASPAVRRSARGGAGEVSAQRTEGALPSPAPSSPQPPVASAPSLTSDLMDDLLDPTISPVNICKIHGLTLDQLADIMDSPSYQRAEAHITRINHQRQHLIAETKQPEDQELQRTIARDAYLAAADISDLAASNSPKLAATKARLLETARKATTQLLPRPSRNTTPPLLPRASGGGAESPRRRGSSPSPPRAPREGVRPRRTEGSSQNRLPRACGGGGSGAAGDGGGSPNTVCDRCETAQPACQRPPPPRSPSP